MTVGDIALWALLMVSAVPQKGVAANTFLALMWIVALLFVI